MLGPTRSWILGELLRYLEHPRSEALEFEDMGESWVSVRDAVVSSTLRPTNKGVAEVAAGFDALLRFVCLRLSQQLGSEVTPILTRAELADPMRRTRAMVTTLTEQWQMVGSIRHLYVILAPSSLGRMPSHTLVIPTRHIETFLDLTDEETAQVANDPSGRDGASPAQLHRSR